MCCNETPSFNLILTMKPGQFLLYRNAITTGVQAIPKYKNETTTSMPFYSSKQWDQCAGKYEKKVSMLAFLYTSRSISEVKKCHKMGRSQLTFTVMKTQKTLNNHLNKKYPWRRKTEVIMCTKSDAGNSDICTCAGAPLITEHILQSCTYYETLRRTVRTDMPRKQAQLFY